MIPAAASNEEDFLRSMAKKIFGVSSNELVLLPVPSGAALTLTGDPNEDYKALYGEFSAFPNNDSYVPHANILQQLKEIYALAKTDSLPISEADDKKFQEYSDKIDKFIEQLEFY